MLTELSRFEYFDDPKPASETVTVPRTPPFDLSVYVC